MSTQSTVRKVLEQRLRSWNELLGQSLPIVWQNSPEGPGETYLAAYLLPVGVRSLDLKGAHRVYEGIFQISIVTPVGDGPGLAEELVKEMDNLFPVNLRLTNTDGTVVTIITPMSPAVSISEAHSYTQPVSCQVRSDTTQT